MKTNLPHEVVLDLLPGYIEHLNHPETDALVQAHLNACPSAPKRMRAWRTKWTARPNTRMKSTI